MSFFFSVSPLVNPDDLLDQVFQLLICFVSFNFFQYESFAGSPGNARFPSVHMTFPDEKPDYVEGGMLVKLGDSIRGWQRRQRLGSLSSLADSRAGTRKKTDFA